MPSRLTVAVVGGDRRESFAAAHLLEQGAAVRVFGQPWLPELEGAVPAANLREAVAGADVVVGPVRGLEADNRLYGQPGFPGLWLTDSILEAVAPGALFCIGWANRWLREAARRHGFRLEELLERDDFSIYNSIPTAEGAVQRAMEESDLTVFGSSCLVLGYGRTGQTLARTLHGLGARVRVAAREPAALARALAERCDPVPFESLAGALAGADFVFNTVPSLVLTERLLARTRPGVVIVDIATAPGGTDFKAAERLGRRAFLTPGLPGRVAPRSAGRFYAQVVWSLALEVAAAAPARP